MKRVAVVTVTYNTGENTKTFLKSLGKVKNPNFSLDVIVVDNGSKKKFALSEQEKRDNITLIRLDYNTGFVGGYNAGIKEALRKNTDYILIANNDTIMNPDLIVNLLEVLESDSKIGVTVPKIYFAKGHEYHKNRYKPEELGKVFWFAGGYFDWQHSVSVHRGIDEVDHGQYEKIEKIDFGSGCCMLIKREVLQKVGLFDERYFLYFEDADLNERIKRAGYDIYYAPKAVLVHANAASSGGAGNSAQDYYITRNKMLFGLTYAPLRTKIALIRQSLRLFFNGRPYQKAAIRDFYLRRFSKGTYVDG